MRRLRFIIDGTAPNQDWKYHVHVQLEPSSANVHDAFIRWQHFKTLRVQFGRMRLPAFGMEYWQSGFMQNGTARTIFTGILNMIKTSLAIALMTFQVAMPG